MELIYRQQMAGYDPYCYWDASRSFDIYGPCVNNYYAGHPGKAGGVEEPLSLDVESPRSSSDRGTGTASTCGEGEVSAC